METRASADSSVGLAPVPGHEAALGRRLHLAPLVDPEEQPVVGHLADAPGDGREADHGVGQAVADQRIGVGAGPQVRGQQRAPGAPVDVVGVAHAVGRVAHVVRGAQHGVDGAERRRLGGEAHVDRAGPGVLHVVADGGTGARAQHQDDGLEPGRQRIGGHQVDHRLAVRPDGRQGLAAAVSPGPARRQDDQRQTRPARRRAHSLQRKTALAQVMPPPNPVSNRLSPSCTRPWEMASWRARGMEAEEVFP